jgi:hypothetical protein
MSDESQELSGAGAVSRPPSAASGSASAAGELLALVRPVPRSKGFGQFIGVSVTLVTFLLLVQPVSAASQTAPDLGALVNERFVRKTGNVLGNELLPSFSGTYKRAPFRTNRWGMRDKEYELKPPPRTYRIALLGTSFTMGGGVPDEQTHEWLLEDRLNREGPGVPRRRYEILNFAVGGYGLLQNVGVTEKKVFPFAPNAVLLMIHSSESRRIMTHVIKLLREGTPIEFPYVREKLQQAGVRPGMEEPELRRRINPLGIDLVRWSYRRIADMCREHGVTLVGIQFPEPQAGRDKEVAKNAVLASEAGIPVLSLDGTYAGHTFESVQLPGDFHLNALGHRLVADRLYQALRANDAQTLKLGFAAPK